MGARAAAQGQSMTAECKGPLPGAHEGIVGVATHPMVVETGDPLS